MGLLDSMVGSALGPLVEGHAHAGGFLRALLIMLKTQPGGLQGLLQKLAGAGLEREAQSWVGTGPNMPISADQATAALGQVEIQQIAQQIEIPPERAASGLATMLPEFIDYLTPNGTLPRASELEDLVAGLISKLDSIGVASGRNESIDRE